MQRRCDRNRQRSKRRAIYCPIHGQYLDSASQKYTLYTDCSKQLQERGLSRKTALLLVANQSVVPLEREWLESFWCSSCQKAEWYHVCKTGDRSYDLRVAPQELWRQAQGVLDPSGNPSVSEFTRRQSRMADCNKVKDFKFVRG